VLITGGLGALGRLVAEHVAGLGVRQLVLVGRRGLDTPGAAELVARLAELGCRAEVIAGDITDPDTLQRALAAVPAEYPLGTVVHSAGSTADGLVTSLTPRTVDSVLRTKLAAAEVLDRLTADDPQVRLVLFSSLAGVLGNAGQANYAAANAALDALAERRRAAGRPAVSLAWGPWQDENGLASELNAADRARMLRSGVAPLPVEHGLRLLDTALGSNEAVLVPVRLDQETLRSGSVPLPELLLELAPQRSRSTATSDDAEQFRNRLATLAPAEQEAAVLELVRHEVAVVLGHSGGESVDPHEPFPNLGFDSLTNLELARRLSAATAVRLSNTVAFDFPTTVELAGRLTSLLS
jgi:NAD(P)-dependent dehydrogenase (short-subunit alcohol dehydrogenase family)